MNVNTWQRRNTDKSNCRSKRKKEIRQGNTTRGAWGPIKMVIIYIFRNLGLGKLKMAGEFSQFFISHCQDLRQSPTTPIATT